MNKPTAKHYYDWVELEDWLKTQVIVMEIERQHSDWAHEIREHCWPDSNNDEMVFFPEVEDLMNDREVPTHVVDILVLLRDAFPGIDGIHYWW